MSETRRTGERCNVCLDTDRSVTPGQRHQFLQMMQLHEDRVKVGVKDRVVAKLRRTTCSEGEVCPVCQDAAHRGIKRVALPCEHKFCEGCIIPWLKENRTCPSCRWEFPDAQVEVKR